MPGRGQAERLSFYRAPVESKTVKAELGAGQTTVFLPLASPPHDSVQTMRTLQVIFGMEQDPDDRKGWLVGAWAEENIGLCPLRGQESEGGEVCRPRSKRPQ